LWSRKKIQAVKITAWLRKRLVYEKPALCFIYIFFIKSFSFWTSLPSFWLPFLTPFIGFSSFQRVEYFIRTPEALVLSYLLFLSKNLVREPQIMLGAPILFHFFKETQHIFLLFSNFFSAGIK